MLILIGRAHVHDHRPYLGVNGLVRTILEVDDVEQGGRIIIRGHDVLDHLALQHTRNHVFEVYWTLHNYGIVLGDPERVVVVELFHWDSGDKLPVKWVFWGHFVEIKEIAHS